MPRFNISTFNEMILRTTAQFTLSHLRRTLFWDSFSQNLLQKIDQYASHTPCPLTVQKISEFCSLSDVNASYEFLRLEIPSRLAGMIKEMGNLPDDMMSIRTIQNVGYLYCSALEQILKFEYVSDHSDKNLKEFYQSISNTLERHQNVPYAIANGMMEYKQRYGPLNSRKTEVIQTFMDRFLLNRISIRMIMRQHVEAYLRLTDEKAADRLPYIEPDCPLKEVAMDAYANAKDICEQSYRYKAAPLKLEEYNMIESGQPVKLTYPRSHLHLIAFELVKNALRAVIEHSECICANSLGIPTNHAQLSGAQSVQLSEMTEREISQRPIIIKLVKSFEDITMCIGDMGGGIPYSVSKYLFQYLYTTANVNLLRNDASTIDTGITPMAGYGCGLPISRLYARYFTGDLKIASVEGRGTDAYVYLKALPAEARENLPVYSPVTEKIYKGQNLAAQWTGKR